MMKYLALVVGAYLALTQTPSSDLGLETSDWLSYKSQFNKVYDSDEVEFMRRAIFAHNKKFVEEFNSKQSKNAGFILGMNHMSDMSTFEINQIYNGYKQEASELKNKPESVEYLDKILNDDSIEVPDELDWRKVPNRVSSVKDQGQCGSCWAFAAIGALEGQEKSLNVSNSIVDLSVQELVDCDMIDMGCNGGHMSRAFDYIAQAGGVEGAESYPYEAKDGECRFQEDKVVITDKGYAYLPAENEEKLKEVVAKSGPVAVAIHAGTELFMYYKSGVYTEPDCGNVLNHGVLIVGYGTDPVGGDYWIVKNSWTEKWGDKGYILMARNKNQCGIALAPIIPTF